MENKLSNTPLVNEVKTLIEQSKQQLSVTVNATMSMLYWQIGKRINDEVEGKHRTELYGKEIVATLWRQLQSEYGEGWGEKHLRHCLRFAETFQGKEIVYTLCRQLSWSHLRMIFFIDDELKRSYDQTYSLFKLHSKSKRIRL